MRVAGLQKLSMHVGFIITTNRAVLVPEALRDDEALTPLEHVVTEDQAPVTTRRAGTPNRPIPIGGDSHGDPLVLVRFHALLL